MSESNELASVRAYKRLEELGENGDFLEKLKIILELSVYSYNSEPVAKDLLLYFTNKITKRPPFRIISNEEAQGFVIGFKNTYPNYPYLRFVTESNQKAAVHDYNSIIDVINIVKVLFEVLKDFSIGKGKVIFTNAKEFQYREAYYGLDKFDILENEIVKRALEKLDIKWKFERIGLKQEWVEETIETEGGGGQGYWTRKEMRIKDVFYQY